MRHVLGFTLAAALTVAGSVAYASDADNNGIQQDEVEHVPGEYHGATAVGESTVIFPSIPADTWNVVYFPHWWNAGDTAYGEHTTDLNPVDHADIEIFLDRNGLTPGCGFIDMNFMIDGEVVGTFQILPEHGLGPIQASFDFTPRMSPFELRYMETNTVVTGCGSVEINSEGMCTVVFTGDSSTPVESTSWSRIKSLY